MTGRGITPQSIVVESLFGLAPADFSEQLVRSCPLVVQLPHR
jgi:hypothetical protein